MLTSSPIITYPSEELESAEVVKTKKLDIYSADARREQQQQLYCRPQRAGMHSALAAVHSGPPDLEAGEADPFTYTAQVRVSLPAGSVKSRNDAQEVIFRDLFGCDLFHDALGTMGLRV